MFQEKVLVKEKNVMVLQMKKRSS